MHIKSSGSIPVYPTMQTALSKICPSPTSPQPPDCLQARTRINVYARCTLQRVALHTSAGRSPCHHPTYSAQHPPVPAAIFLLHARQLTASVRHRALLLFSPSLLTSRCQNLDLRDKGQHTPR